MLEVNEIENKIIELDTKLTETAFEHFTQGDVSETQLTELYEVMSTWSRISETLLQTMQNLNIGSRYKNGIKPLK